MVAMCTPQALRLELEATTPPPQEVLYMMWRSSRQLSIARCKRGAARRLLWLSPVQEIGKPRVGRCCRLPAVGVRAGRLGAYRGEVPRAAQRDPSAKETARRRRHGCEAV